MKIHIVPNVMTLPPKTGPFEMRVLLFILTEERGTFHEEPVYS
jgi:hypothetical protein